MLFVLDNGSTTTTAKKRTTTSATPATPTRKPHTPHSPAIKALALAAVTHGGTTDEAAAVTGVPTRTIRGWVEELEQMGASDVEELVAEKTKVIRGLWALWGVELFEFAAELMAAGNAKGVLYIITAAGICDTKLSVMPGDMRPRYGGAPPARIVVEGSSSASSDARERIRARLAAPADPLPHTDVSDSEPPSTDGT